MAFAAAKTRLCRKCFCANLRPRLLLEDLQSRGLFEETFVVCMGEFDRTPQINAQAGRDHWSRAQSIVFAGAGIRAGSVMDEPTAAPSRRKTPSHRPT